MTDENVVVDRNDRLKECTQQSRTIILQRFSPVLKGGLIEP